jgi:DNA repair protein SbcC/Rad50
MFTLQSVTVEGFRGFTKKTQFDLDAPVVVALGPNGGGKSSLACAVEWCLFGSGVETEKNTGIRERISWESRNHRSAQCSVEVELDAEGETLVVHRLAPKSGRSEFWFRLGSAAPVRDEGELRALLGGLEIKDFFTAVHLHQESLRTLLLAKPGERKQDFYRLLGLASLLNQVNAISDADLESMLGEVDREFEEFETALKGKILGRQADIERARRECLDNGLAESDLSRDGLPRLWGKLGAKIGRFCSAYAIKDCGLPGECPGKDAARVAKQQLQRLRGSCPALQEQGSVLAQINTLGGLREAYEKAANQLKLAEAEIKKLPPGERDPSKLEDEIQKLDEELKGKKRKRSEADEKAAVLSEALAYFDKLKITGKAKCPVCGQGIDSVETLREHYDKEIRGRILGALDREINEISSRRKAANDAKEKIEGLQDEARRKEKLVTAERAKIATALGRELSSKDDPLTFLDKEIGQLGKRREELRKQVERIEEDLGDIEKLADRVATLQELIRLQDDLNAISQTSKTEAFRRAEAARLEIESFARAVEALSRSLTRTLEEEAEKRLGSVKDGIGEAFKALTGRADFPRLVVSPDTKFAARVEGGPGVAEALAVLNQADTNCAAISIFLALAVAPTTSHKLGFLILDDPSQSLDGAHSRRLAEVLAKTAESRQLLVATADEELSARLQEGVTKRKKVYSFGGWDAGRGPTFTVS